MVTQIVCPRAIVGGQRCQCRPKSMQDHGVAIVYCCGCRYGCCDKSCRLLLKVRCQMSGLKDVEYGKICSSWYALFKSVANNGQEDMRM